MLHSIAQASTAYTNPNKAPPKTSVVVSDFMIFPC
jgi:hypothetical protein